MTDRLALLHEQDQLMQMTNSVTPAEFAFPKASSHVTNIGTQNNMSTHCTRAWSSTKLAAPQACSGFWLAVTYSNHQCKAKHYLLLWSALLLPKPSIHQLGRVHQQSPPATPLTIQNAHEHLVMPALTWVMCCTANPSCIIAH